jgi:hypothetical protein
VVPKDSVETNGKRLESRRTTARRAAKKKGRFSFFFRLSRNEIWESFVMAFIIAES